MQGSNSSILVVKTYFLAQNLDYHPSCLGFHRFTTGFHNYTPESTKKFQTVRKGPRIPYSSTEAPTEAAAGLESRWKVTQILPDTSLRHEEFYFVDGTFGTGHNQGMNKLVLQIPTQVFPHHSGLFRLTP